MPQWTDDPELWRSRIYHQTLSNVKLHFSREDRVRRRLERLTIHHKAQDTDPAHGDAEVMSKLTQAFEDTRNSSTQDEADDTPKQPTKSRLCLTAAANMQAEKIVRLFRDQVCVCVCFRPPHTRTHTHSHPRAGVLF